MIPSSVRDFAYRIGAIARHNKTIRLRDPGQMIAYIVMPMISMLVLKPLYVRAVHGGATQVVRSLHGRRVMRAGRWRRGCGDSRGG